MSFYFICSLIHNISFSILLLARRNNTTAIATVDTHTFFLLLFVFLFSGENFQLNASKFPSSSTTLGVTYLIDLCLGCLHVCSLSLLPDISFLLYLYLFHLLHSVTLYLIVWFFSFSSMFVFSLVFFASSSYGSKFLMCHRQVDTRRLFHCCSFWPCQPPRKLSKMS